jgi:hypothetical protein
MKKLIFLIPLVLLISVSLAEAQTPISSCTDINSSGTYVLTADLYLTDPTRSECIRINSGNVVLDLNGRTIYNNLTNRYGIWSGVWLTRISNITIRNGNIKGFDVGIFLGGINNVAIENIETHNKVGMDLGQITNLNITNCRFYDFSPKTFPAEPEYYGLKLNGIDGSSYIRSSEFGKQEVVGGYLRQYAPDIGLQCSNSNGIAFSNLKLLGLNYGAKFSNCDSNTLWCSMFFQYDGYANGALFESSSTNNWGCNLNGYINDLDANTFVPTCPTPPDGVDCPYQICAEGYTCVNESYSGYILSNCTIVNTTYCQYGCYQLTGKCKESPSAYCGNGICEYGETAYNCPSDCVTTTTTMLPSQQPFVNEEQLKNLGVGWMAFFFTPMFFATIMLVGIAGFISLAIAKHGGGQFAPATFIIISMIMLAVYGIYQIYPPWLVIVLTILAGFVFAKFVLGVI